MPLPILAAMALADWELEWLMAAPEPPPTLADLVPARPAWQARAACREESTAMFFPAPGASGKVNQARAICQPCPVRQACLAYALAEDMVGVWGGTTDQERRAMRREAL